MTIVGVDDLRAYMGGIRLTASAVQSAPVILDGLQGEMETFLRYPIEGDPPITENVGVTTRGESMGSVNYVGYLDTSRWPIASVASVLASDGTPVTFTFTADGDLFLPDGGPYDTEGYTVTYTPGLPPRALAMAKVKIMRAAERELAPKHDDSRQADGSPNGRRSQPVTTPGWLKGELRSLSRWRRRADSAVYSRPRPWLPDAGPSYDAVGGYYPGAIEVGGVVSATSPMAFGEGDATLPEGPA